MKYLVILLFLIPSLPQTALSSGTPEVMTTAVAQAQFIIVRVHYTKGRNGLVSHMRLDAGSNLALAKATGFEYTPEKTIRYRSPDGTIVPLLNEVDVLNKMSETGWELVDITSQHFTSSSTYTSYIFRKDQP